MDDTLFSSSACEAEDQASNPTYLPDAGTGAMPVGTVPHVILLPKGYVHSSLEITSEQTNYSGEMAATPAKGGNYMAQWAYKVAYVDYRGRISCEGLETLRGDNERRSAFARRYMNTLGKEGWELVGIQPLTANSASYVFNR